MTTVPRRRSRWLAGLAALVLVGALVALLVVRGAHAGERARDDAAVAAAQAFAAGWQQGELPDAAQETFEEVTAGLGGVDPEHVDVVSLERDGDRATARLRVTWPFGDGWTYESTLPLAGDLEAADGGRWAPQPAADVVHPDLAAGDRLVADRTWPRRADVIGRDGQPLVTASPVVEVGVHPSRAEDPQALSAALAEILDVDAVALAERIGSASPDAFVPVITLRQADYDDLREDLQPLPGTVFREATLPLAPTREFARALLGTVGPVTAELVEDSGGRLAPGDVAGLSGLQRQYDERLAGAPGVTVARLRGEERTELLTVEPVPGQPVTLTLDAVAQQAADDALATTSGDAALVAVDVPTGELLAVANTPASGTDRALTGQYPPGSTFKTVSTLALLGTGLAPGQTVSCPATATIEGRAFRNAEGGAAGDVPFRSDFAESCNTAFVSLSARLRPGDLTAAAATLGLGVDWRLGVPVFPGSVPVEESAVELAAATIGQGEVLASPVAMAQAVAAVARGQWVAPSLVTEPAPPGEPPQVPPADPERLATVRDLMRAVVEDGTATALADVPGGPVAAKTGTAEFGTEDPPRTHAWTVGFQGEVAFAVLVEQGASGGEVAVPVAEAFLSNLEAR